MERNNRPPIIYKRQDEECTANLLPIRDGAWIRKVYSSLSPPTTTEVGYRSRDYITALKHLGSPRLLPASGGYLLERRIPHSEHRDATGPYPLFDCRDWDLLGDDLEELSQTLVSLVLIPTPFMECRVATLRRLFPDLCRVHKRHYVVDLTESWRDAVSRHHSYYAKRALKRLRVLPCGGDVHRWVPQWIGLYEQLARRHGIQGVYDFPVESLGRQLALPGMQVYRAEMDSEVVGMQLWLRDGPRAYYHLSAYSENGYRASASYAMVFHVLSQLREQGVAWADLGGGAGGGDNGSQGLDKFKAGWTAATRDVYLCGRIFDQRAYRALLSADDSRPGGYFPAYRSTRPA